MYNKRPLLILLTLQPFGSNPLSSRMKKEFLSKGWATEEQWDSVHTPIGMEIGSKTIEEIAVSIAAQLVLERSKKQGTRLC